MNFKRIFINGAKNFFRSGAVSFATVLIMTVTLAIVGLLIFLSAILYHTLDAIKDKVDVNIYFVTDAPEPSIIAYQRQLSELPEVERVTYTSRDAALTDFRERHSSDPLITQALEELGGNPLGGSLAVKAKDPAQYEAIVSYVYDNLPSASDGNSLIETVNYAQNKVVIERLTNAIQTTERTGAGIVLLFALASMVIAFATIRLAIYTARDEIAIMRLMGASNMYIRGPFIVAGTMAGVLAGIIVLILFYPIAWYAGGAMEAWLGGFNLFTYYTGHFATFFGILIGSGFIIGALASYFAVRKYLKI